ncbi:hypothetical protein [Methylobacterium sp. WSM2598]|uniref:hypothetical protein n=1 Tax=Methylobacterium sp. WSM2598 TaxID=398261 RepID=UPI00036C29AF|nr:hypothetical protein [Methylobacterium sp. WSM2598]
MRRSILTGLAALLALSGAAPAQDGRAPGAAARTAASGSARLGLGGAAAAQRDALLQSAPADPSQRPPRPATALGPDIVAPLFAPIGLIVSPVTEGLHLFDEAVAPLGEVLRPVTGPSNPAPAEAPAPGAQAPAVSPRK